MFDDFVLPELVSKTKSILEQKGENGLINYDPYFGECGCRDRKMAIFFARADRHVY